MDTLPDVFQRCLLFLSIHALPSFAVLACMPLLYRSMGQAPEVRHLVWIQACVSTHAGLIRD